MNNQPNDMPDLKDKLLQGVISALRDSDAPPAPIPDEIDAAIRARVRRHFALVRRRRLLLRLAPVGLAAAAALLLLVQLPIWPGGVREYARRSHPSAPAVSLDMPHAPAMRAAKAPREDYDGNGRVDMRDALVFAQQVHAGRIPPEWDLNADGHVTLADADVIAMAAVRMPGG